MPVERCLDHPCFARQGLSRDTPVPLPVTRSTEAPVMAAMMALLAVVLPIPMSPVTTQD